MPDEPRADFETAAQLALGDAIAMALLELRGLRPEDYAALHPRGTLGWRAMFRVSDLMHRGPALPVVTEDVLIKDAVREMTAKRLGVTAVVDRSGRLVGVITDGDLRRLHLREGPVSDLRAGDVATRDPKLIRADDLAAKALEVMETFAITSLIIVDSDHRPSGIIHMHDILRAKIV